MPEHYPQVYFVHFGLQDESLQPSKHAYMGPIWRVQPGSTWVPYGLAHMRVAQMGPI